MSEDSERPYTSTHDASLSRERHAQNWASYQNITGKIVGPMSFRTFVNQLLPGPPMNFVDVDKPNGQHLAELRKARMAGICHHFVQAFQTNLENIVMIDAQAQPTAVDPQTYVSLYSISIIGQAIRSRDDVPFDEKSTDQSEQTLGEIAACATAHLASQSRSHLFFLLIFPSYTRILRGDRAGVIVAEKISHETSQDTLQLAEFLVRYDRATPLGRGIEPFVEAEVAFVATSYFSSEGRQGSRKFRKYRLVLNQHARSIQEFRNVRELVQAWRDALQAHREAQDKANILHGDISAGKLMIWKGLLVDWDISRFTYSKTIERRGTWQFIAYRLSQARRVNEPIPAHDRDDDLESFWYVVVWIACRSCEHNLSDANIRVLLKTSFDTLFYEQGAAMTDMARFATLLYSRSLILHIGLQSRPLQQLDKDVQEVAVLRYTLSEIQIKIVSEAWKSIKLNNQGSPQQVLQKQLRHCLFQMDELIPFDPNPCPAHKLESPMWAKHIADSILCDHNLDWETGSENVERNLVSR